MNGDNLTPFDDLDKVLKLQDEPFCAPNMALTRGVWRSAREHGVKVLLDGLFGDNVVSHGIEYLNELAQKWRLVRLGQELRQLIDRSGRDVKLGDPLLDYWVREGIKPHVPRAILRAWRKHRGYASNPTEYQLSLFQPSFAEPSRVAGAPHQCVR
ncbi:MAG: hypothetical protein IPK58_24845 [Acidobacteria bacterium]|nr:hypothetical protein [Acidobacteriota bacterium]